MTPSTPASAHPAPAGSVFLTPPLPRMFAHRGLAIEAPENTLLAFDAATKVGAMYIETDVQVSADGIAVVAHDPDLRRVADQRVLVSSLSMAELARIDLGCGQTFCSLAEAIDAFSCTRFNIDVKAPGAAAATVDAVLAAGARDRVLITSFSERRRAAAASGLPGVASSASALRFGIALLAGKFGITPVMRIALLDLVAVQVPERALGITVTSPRMLGLLHGAGVEVHIWTINDPARMRELLDLGVDGIVTDRIDLALEVVRERSGPGS